MGAAMYMRACWVEEEIRRPPYGLRRPIRFSAGPTLAEMPRTRVHLEQDYCTRELITQVKKTRFHLRRRFAGCRQ
jgi:hypothetical protein